MCALTTRRRSRVLRAATVAFGPLAMAVVLEARAAAATADDDVLRALFGLVDVQVAETVVCAPIAALNALLCDAAANDTGHDWLID
ncbi:hypothetical protein BKA81DRAFT_372405 [Phyllosticta paracitricarpa]